MSYTKKIASIIITALLSACSQTSTQTSALKSNVTAESTEHELQLYKNAVIALNNNELAAAEKLFTQMSERQPSIAGPWVNLALIAIKKDQLEQAEKLVELALDKNPHMSQALNLSGYLYEKKGDLKQAKIRYQQAIKNDPNYAIAHYNLALLYDVYFQEIKKAIEHYQLYLAFTDTKDENTENWVAELKASI